MTLLKLFVTFDVKNPVRGIPLLKCNKHRKLICHVHYTDKKMLLNQKHFIPKACIL